MARKNDDTVTRGSGNVFADIGLDHPEEVLAKARIVETIAGLLERKQITQQEAGKIVNFYAFYPAKSGEMTFALLIEHNDFVVNYGEVKANSNKIYKWKIGDNVEAGQAIARVSATAMTHFETYMKGTTRNERFMKGGSRPPHLLNPTVYLLEMNSI